MQIEKFTRKVFLERIRPTQDCEIFSEKITKHSIRIYNFGKHFLIKTFDNSLNELDNYECFFLEDCYTYIGHSGRVFAYGRRA